MNFIHIHDDILSKEDCQKFITFINTNTDRIVLINNALCKYYRLEGIFEELAVTLFNKIKDALPEIYKKTTFINKNFRFSKYTDGMEFGIHRDGSYNDNYGNKSIFTINIFLNDNYDGGETSFFNDDNQVIKIVGPKIGRASIFNGSIKHCGNKVINGTKYLMRSDLMIMIDKE